MIRIFRLFLLLVSLTGLVTWGGNAYAVACASVATGNWGTVATWNCGHVPAAGDTVNITLGQTVTLNVNSTVLASLTVNGVLTTAGASGSDLYIGGNIVNNGTINMQASTGTNSIYLAGANITSTFSGTGTWLLDNLDLNGTGANPCTGACKVEISGSPNLQFVSATLFAGNTASFTFNALGNSTATVTLNRAGNQTVAATGVTYPDLVLGGSGTKTLGTANNQTLNILGSMTVNTGLTASTGRTGITVAVAGNFINNGTYTSTNITNLFNGALAQTIGGTSTTTFNNLTVANTGAGSTSLLLNTAVAGNLSVNSGTLDLGAFTANRTAAGGTLTVANGATLMMGGANSFPANYTTHTLGAASTVVYNGTNQSVAAEAAPGYGYLTLSGSGTKTAAGSFIVRSDMVIGSGVTLASGTTTQTVNGNLTNNGTQTATTGNITLSGGAATHTLSGNGSYGNLILNDALGATLTGSPTVSGVLTLTSGIITTGANTLEVTSSCVVPSIVGASAARYVLGNLTLHYPAGTNSCIFPIGDATAYTPATVTIVTVTSTLANSALAASTTTGDHPDTTAGTTGIDAAKSVNRYWSLTPGAGLTFATYDTTFNFVAGDVDVGASTANFIIGHKNGGVWSYPTVGAKTGTSTQATGMSLAGGFGVFVIGERWFPSFTVIKSVAVFSDPVNGTSNPKFIPGAIAQYTIMVTNFGGVPDNNSVVVSDPVPANMSMCVSTVCNNPPVVFSCSTTPPCGLTYTYASNVTYSSAPGGGAPFTYIPVPDANGFDAAVTGVSINPQGIMNVAVGGNPNFSLFLKMQVK